MMTGIQEQNPWWRTGKWPVHDPHLKELSRQKMTWEPPVMNAFRRLHRELHYFIYEMYLESF